MFGASQVLCFPVFHSRCRSFCHGRAQKLALVYRLAGAPACCLRWPSGYGRQNSGYGSAKEGGVSQEAGIGSKSQPQYSQPPEVVVRVEDKKKNKKGKSKKHKKRSSSTSSSSSGSTDSRRDKRRSKVKRKASQSGHRLDQKRRGRTSTVPPAGGNPEAAGRGLG